MNKFLHDEGVLVVVKPGSGPDGGTVMGSAAGDRNMTDDQLPPPSVLVTNEHYNRMVRLVEKGIPVTLEFDIAAEVHPSRRFFQHHRRDSRHETGFRHGDGGRPFRFVDRRHRRHR